jgi:hypothetical protein
MLGLLTGWLFFPESNLLGGLALVFAPLAWIGAALLIGACLARVRSRRDYESM